MQSNEIAGKQTAPSAGAGSRESPHTCRAEIASHTPGRLRIRLRPDNRGPEHMQRIREKIGAREGIHEVRSNQATGSVTVRYDRQRYGKEGIFQTLRDADVVIEDLTRAEQPPPGEMDFDAAVADLSRRTGIDLRKALPLAFVAAGIWSFARRGLMIEQVPGWFFLWLALDTFMKLHSRTRKS